jgi:hypothetical protein
LAYAICASYAAILTEDLGAFVSKRLTHQRDALLAVALLKPGDAINHGLFIRRHTNRILNVKHQDAELALRLRHQRHQELAVPARDLGTRRQDA